MKFIAGRAGAGDRNPSNQKETIQMPDKAKAIYPSLNFPGRSTLRVQEIAAKLRIHPKHVIDLIIEGKFGSVDVCGLNASRSCYRIPIEAYREFISSSTTLPNDLQARSPNGK